MGKILTLLLTYMAATFICHSQKPVVIISDGSDGAPLPNVQIVITDTKSGLIVTGSSSKDGVFSLSPSIFNRGKYKTVLTHSFYGKVIKENVDYTQDTVKLSMGIDEKHLDEVTVTAYANE